MERGLLFPFVNMGKSIEGTNYTQRILKPLLMAVNNKFRRTNERFGKTSSLKLPQQGHEAQNDEYGKEHKGVIECPECRNVHFEKGWHHSIWALNKHLKQEQKVARRELCRACKITRDHLFEGELLIAQWPEQHREELLNLIHNFGELAVKLNPQHRIITIAEVAPNSYKVATTENQLADRLGKKIKKAFNHVELHFSYSKEPYKVDRVHATFHHPSA
jgi:hypothetical protein